MAQGNSVAIIADKKSGKTYKREIKPENLRINGKIPYYGGGDDAELTSYVIRRGYLSTKSFEADVVVEPKRDFHFLQELRQLRHLRCNPWGETHYFSPFLKILMHNN